MEGNRSMRYDECVRQYGEQNSDNHCEAIGFDVYNFAITGGVSKTLNAIATDSDHIPCVLVLNDQGGAVMHVSEDVTSTLRANTKHHEPIVLILEHHPHDSRIAIKDDDICQSLTQRMGTGGGATCHW